MEAIHSQVGSPISLLLNRSPSCHPERSEGSQEGGEGSC